MALVINAQLASFVEFARLQTNDKAIARVGVAAAGDGPLAGRTITAATRDKVAPIGPRSGDDKRANVANVKVLPITKYQCCQLGIGNWNWQHWKLATLSNLQPLNF